MSDSYIPDAEQLISALVERMRPEVGPETGFIGIQTGGAWVAERLHRALKPGTALATLDVSYYRDDYDRRGLHREPKASDVPYEVEGREIVLVDDVLYTGRTIRAALIEIFDYGRPANVRLAVLVDRGGRQLPIAAQFTGAAIDLPPGKSLALERGPKGRLSFALQDRDR